LTAVLSDLRKQQTLETEKEEFRKKYENYKKMFIDQKTEKDAKIKEL
jgi:chromosome segregation ATPase